jgi:hypothetical protein
MVYGSKYASYNLLKTRALEKTRRAKKPSSESVSQSVFKVFIDCETGCFGAHSRLEVQ